MSTHQHNTQQDRYAKQSFVQHMHDELYKDEEKQIVWLEKHYGHKPEVLSRKLDDLSHVMAMAHDMVDHYHKIAQCAGNMVTISVPSTAR